MHAARILIVLGFMTTFAAARFKLLFNTFANHRNCNEIHRT